MPNKLDAPETATPPATTSPAKARKTRKTASARLTRVRTPDPEKDAAKAEFKAKLAAINTKQASAKLLATCIKRLAKMIPEHRLILAEHLLMPVATPPLPMN